MRNFLRSLKFAYTYRWRFCASVVCAIFAATLWAMNLSAIYPVMQLLFRPGQTWAVQLDEEINK
jgi:ATP-binding cassette subfamily B protein/subfamily B ATP-binding cassette protein MsbA